MNIYVFFAILGGALLHAGWNSLLKIGLDRASTMILLSLVQAGVAIPVLCFIPAPLMASWGWIVAAALLHSGYKIF
ncbi:hypothetical protein [Celerinatantimonas sp. YJH-8]|uniref:hypothetical protein n=1 Tax=Celerinatantimonas sp. YJH-8 TaxID=3228714 RepID=UPI0038C45A26